MGAHAGLLLAGEDSGKAGPLGLLIVVLLGIACYWLFRSMSRHLRKVPGSFAAPGPGSAPGAGVDPTETAPGIRPQPVERPES